MNYLNYYFLSVKTVDDVVSSVSTADLIAAVFWDKESSEQLKLQILEEKSQGTRDQASIFLGLF